MRKKRKKINGKYLPAHLDDGGVKLHKSHCCLREDGKIVFSNDEKCFKRFIFEKATCVGWVVFNDEIKRGRFVARGSKYFTTRWRYSYRWFDLIPEFIDNPLWSYPRDTSDKFKSRKRYALYRAKQLRGW